MASQAPTFNVSFLILTDMERLTRFLKKFQLAHVIVNLESQFSLTYNGYKDVMQYTNEIGKSEMALLEEYVRHMESPGKKYWNIIYHNYLSRCKNYFCLDDDYTLQNIKLKIVIKGGDGTGRLPEAAVAKIQEFLFVQYNSLNRVLECMEDNSQVFPSCFKWNGKPVELLEYLLYPFMTHMILPLEKNATQTMWINSMFKLLNVPLIKHLNQAIHKLLLREDPFRFLHNLEAKGRLALEKG